jgi:hypothetical protein
MKSVLLRKFILISFAFINIIFIYSVALASPKSVDALLPHYDLSVRLLPDARRLEATGTMRLPAANIDRNNLELSLSELMEDFRVEIVSPAVSAGAARLDKSVRPYSRPGWGTVTWKVSPPRPIPASEPILLRFSYAGGGRADEFYFQLKFGSLFWGGYHYRVVSRS